MGVRYQPYPQQYRASLPNGTRLICTLDHDDGRVRLHATLLSEGGIPCEHFGNRGSVRLNLGKAPGRHAPPVCPPRLISRSDGEFIYIGLSHPRKHWQALVLRLNARGQLDIGWGYRTFQVQNLHTLLNDFAVLPDGRLLACGVRWSATDGIRQGFLARLRRDGALDPLYGDAGFARLRGGRQDSGYTCMGPAQAEGDRWLLGFCASGGNSQLLTVTALDDQGVAQPGYAGILPVACHTLDADAVHHRAGGYALITGTATRRGPFEPRSRTFAAGLLPNGRFDGGFGNGTALEWLAAGQRLACL